MRLLFSLFAGIVITVLLPNAAQSACNDTARKAANGAVSKVATAENTAIPLQTFMPVTDEIAATVCASTAAFDEHRAAEVSSKVSQLYFESAIRLGKAVEVPVLVDSVIDNKNGLGLDDIRRFGVLTVNCASASSVVEVRESQISCGARTLIDRGSLAIRVLDSFADVCEANLMLAERQEFACNCQARANTPAIPVQMECTTQ
jgi:hypothetical protein